MSKKGEIEINEIFIVLLLLVSVLAAVWISGNNSYSDKNLVKVTDADMNQFLDDQLYTASEYFYAANPDGEFNIYTYKWASVDMNSPPDAEPLPIPGADATIPNNPTLFDGKYLYEIRGFGVKVFERTDVEQPVDIEAAAVFVNTSDTMDGYYKTQESFTVRFYDSHTIRHVLENCHVRSYRDSITESGNFIRSYYIHCNVIWEP